MSGSWWGLDSVLKDAAIEADYYRSAPPMACPHDGEPLASGPPNNPTVLLFCRFDGFAYPRDWNPDTMSGM